MVTDTVLSSLGDPVRREIVRRLSGASLSVNEIAAGFEISRPAISRHLRLLREAGVVSETRSGRERIYRLESEALGVAGAWLSEVALDRPKRPGKKRVPEQDGELATAPGRPAGAGASEWRQW